MEDLFETPELIPQEITFIFEKHWGECGDNTTYKTLEAARIECEALGYTFDYYLDATPFDLHKI